MKKLEPGMAYDTNKLNKLFAFLSILFLMIVVWVFLDDYIRPWKAVQIEALKIKQTKLQEKYELADKDINKEKLAELEKELAAARADQAEKRLEINSAEREIFKLQKFLKEETITNGILNSKVSATNFKYEQAQLKHDHNATEEYYSMLTDYKEKFAVSKDRMKTYQQTEKELKRKVFNLRAGVTEAEKEISKIVGTRGLIKKALDSTSMGPIFAIRNAPERPFYALSNAF